MTEDAIHPQAPEVSNEAWTLCVQYLVWTAAQKPAFNHDQYIPQADQNSKLPLD